MFEFSGRDKKEQNMPSPNKKGQGFRMFRPIPQKQIYENASRRLRLGMAASFVMAATALYFIGKYASIDVTITVGSMMVLAGLLSYDIISGFIWEKSTKAQLKNLTRNHDRLVREVARNRNDIALLQDLSGRNTLRTDLTETKHNAGIIELEINPPPPRSPAAEQNNQQGTLSNSFITELLHYTVRNDKIEVHVQPIVNLPQQQVQMYELFARLPSHAGTYLTAARYMALAKQENVIASIDNLLLLRCLQMLRDKENLGPALPYVINVSSATLNDGGFMGDLVTFLSQEKTIANRLIFELPQTELENINKKTTAILKGLSKIGCRFSVDRVSNKIININLMKNRHISLIKLDAGWLLKESNTRKGRLRIKNLKKQLDLAGIDLIVEKVETPKQVRELTSLKINFGQGYLFGKPDIYAAYRDQINLKHSNTGKAA